MTRPRWLTYATSTVVVLLLPRVAEAATSLQTTLSAHQAEVGEGIRVELSAMSDDESPGNPRLRVPPGFSVQGPSVSSSQQISFANGHFEHRRGITVDWLIVGTHPGRFVVGPATVDVGGSVLQGETAQVEVVAAGAAPKPQRQNPFDPGNSGNPFDPFGMLQRLPNFPGMNDLDDSQLLGTPPEAPAEFVVEHAPDPMAFLRAVVTPTEAVVGQQVTLRVYAYGGRGPYDEVGSSEPSRADFLSQVLVDSSYRQPRYMVSIDGVRWSAVKLREVALFPLHAGSLTIGPMRMGFRGPGYPEAQQLQGLVRESPTLHVNVTEPPVAGRPPGYELGDVGSYTITADVDPRRVEAGDAVAATIRLEGTGNLPEHVKHTDQRGVDWLEPTVTEAINPNDATVAGWRAFRYVVRLDEPGVHDLGEATLPYYDPRTRRYEVARARLGTVEVAPGKTANAAPSSSVPAAQAPRDPFDGVGAVRKKLDALPPPRRYLTDTKSFWALLVGGPCSVIALGGLTELARAWRRRSAARSESRSVLARRALGDAKVAAERRDGVAVAAAVERAVYAAIEDRFDLRARAVLRESLRTTLERRGAEAELAKDVVELLDACDGLRFAGGSEGGPPSAVERASSVVARLSRARPKARESAA